MNEAAGAFGDGRFERDSMRKSAAPSATFPSSNQPLI